MGSIQTPCCVHLELEALPQHMVLEGSENPLQGGLGDHQQRKKHQLAEAWASHLRNCSPLVSAPWKVPAKAASEPEGDAPGGPEQAECFCCLRGCSHAPVCPSKPRYKRGLDFVFHSPGIADLPAAWSCLLQGMRVSSICLKFLIVFVLST